MREAAHGLAEREGRGSTHDLRFEPLHLGERAASGDDRLRPRYCPEVRREPSAPRTTAAGSGFRRGFFQATTSTRPKSSPGSMAAFGPDLYLHLVGQAERYSAIVFCHFCSGRPFTAPASPPSARFCCRAGRRALRLPALRVAVARASSAGSSGSSPSPSTSSPTGWLRSLRTTPSSVPPEHSRKSYDKEGFRKRHDLSGPMCSTRPPGRWKGLAGADGRVRDRLRRHFLPRPRNHRSRRHARSGCA